MRADAQPAEPSRYWVQDYVHTLTGKAPETVEAYTRVLRALTAWIAERPGSDGRFQPHQLTQSALQTYLSHLGERGYSVSSRPRVKAVAGSFARWLIEDEAVLQRNPARGVVLPSQALLAPRELSSDQRYVLANLVERTGDVRGEALFALGYWGGCRVSDVAWLRAQDAHIGPKIGWLTVGHKGNKKRDIDLVNQARRPLYDYMRRGGRDAGSEFVFTSQRSARLTEAGVHHWWRGVRALATKDEWELICDVTFHDLRHDFAHRARAAGWSIEEVAYYLGHVTSKGLPAIQTTARYTQVSREQLKAKLRLLKG